MRVEVASRNGVAAQPEGLAVIDDNQLIGNALERWLSRSNTYRFIGAFSSPESALRAFAASPPRIVLLDVDIPGCDSFAMLSKLTSDYPQTAVIMLSGHGQAEFIERALDAGAAGYIIKDEGIPVIMDLIRQAAAGKIVLSPSARSSLASSG